MQPDSSLVSCPRVEVANHYAGFGFKRSEIRRFFSVVFSLHPPCLSGELSIVFLDRSTHCQLHGRFLHDYGPTDVITFPADAADEMVGEICISVDQAREESVNRKVCLSHEVCLYLIHGWLHLVGFDDKQENDRKIMRREEERVMEEVNKLGVRPVFRLAIKETVGYPESL